MPKRLTKENFIERAKKIHNDKYDYSNVEYTNNSTKVCIVCPEHGEFWQIPDSHLRGRGCPVCRWNKAKNSIRKKQGLTREEFIEKARAIHGEKYDYSEVVYENTETNVRIICPEHGEFLQRPHHHLHGSGCPICGRNDLSEMKLADIVKDNFHNVVSQYNPEFLIENGKQQSIDIYLPDLNIGIEYQGRQHFIPVSRFGGSSEYEKTVERDERKFKKCAENGVKLIYFTWEKEAPSEYIGELYTDENDLIKILKNDRY